MSDTILRRCLSSALRPNKICYVQDVLSTENAGPENAGPNSLRKRSWKRKDILNIIMIYYLVLRYIVDFVISFIYGPSVFKLFIHVTTAF